MNKQMKLKSMLMGAGIGIGLSALPVAHAEVPNGYFQGELISSQGRFQAELFIRTEGEPGNERHFALYFNHAADRTWGNVFTVEELDDGLLAFRRLYLDPQSPTVEAWEAPWMLGAPSERLIRGGRREFEIQLRNGEANAEVPITWIVRRTVPAAHREWLNLEPNRPMLGRAQSPYQGEATTSFVGSSGNYFLNFRINGGPNGFIPYNVAAGRLELREIFPGIYSARRIDADLTAVSGSQAGQNLYGIVALVTNRSGVRVWRELRVLTYSQELTDRGTVPGTVFSTTVVSFGE